MEVNKSIFKRQADFLEKNGKYILQFTALEKCKKNGGKNCKIVINICNVKGEYRDFTF